MLEKYIKKGSNISKERAECWAGEYPLSILDDAIRIIAPRIGFGSPQELVKQYPNMPKYQNSLESLMCDIGLENIGFPVIRNKVEDFALVRYGIPCLPVQAPVIPVAPAALGM